VRVARRTPHRCGTRGAVGEDEDAFRRSGGGVPTDTSAGCPVVDVTVRRLADLDERITRLTEVRERLASALNHRFGELFSRLERGSEKAA
jgi:hypothetical protein